MLQVGLKVEPVSERIALVNGPAGWGAFELARAGRQFDEPLVPDLDLHSPEGDQKGMLLGRVDLQPNLATAIDARRIEFSEQPWRLGLWISASSAARTNSSALACKETGGNGSLALWPIEF